MPLYVIDDLREDAGPIDGIHRGEVELLLHVAHEEGLDDVLAIIEVSLHLK